MGSMLLLLFVHVDSRPVCGVVVVSGLQALVRHIFDPTGQNIPPPTTHRQVRLRVHRRQINTDPKKATKREEGTQEREEGRGRSQKRKKREERKKAKDSRKRREGKMKKEAGLLYESFRRKPG